MQQIPETNSEAKGPCCPDCGEVTYPFEGSSSWQQQASVNAYLCHKNGIPITKARYIAIFRDWSKPRSMVDPNHPNSQVMVFNVPLWSLEETEVWITQRIQSHEEALQSLPECTESERWNRGPKVAIMKGANKRALRVLDSQEEAEAWLKDNPQTSPTTFQERPGENMRCEYYCPVVKFCQQAKDLGVKAALS